MRIETLDTTQLDTVNGAVCNGRMINGSDHVLPHSGEPGHGAVRSLLGMTEPQYDAFNNSLCPPGSPVRVGPDGSFTNGKDVQTAIDAVNAGLARSKDSQRRGGLGG
jgi:hypothetical protein